MMRRWDIMGMPAVDAAAKPNRYEGATITSPSEEYRTIPLTRGQVAKVSPEDYEWLSQWKWRAMPRLRRSGPPIDFNATRPMPLRPGRKQGTIYMHREILGLKHGDDREADHINHDTLDNRRGNLRVATRGENLWNKRGASKSGYKGVVKHRSAERWLGYIEEQGKTVYLGCFASPEAAARAYDAAALRIQGAFACINFPEQSCH